MEISPGKGHILRSIPAASTTLGLLPTGFAVLCLLTHPQRPRYAVPVRQYGPLQSRFLQCRGHPQPPCALLTGFDNSPARDLPPLDIQRTMLPCGSRLGPCWAHTYVCRNPPSSCCQLPLKHDNFIQEQDHERRTAASAGPLNAISRIASQSLARTAAQQRSTRNTNAFREHVPQLPPHAVLTLGSSTAYSRSTTTFITTKMVAKTSTAPITTGKSSRSRALKTNGHFAFRESRITTFGACSNTRVCGHRTSWSC